MRDERHRQDLFRRTRADFDPTLPEVHGMGDGQSTRFSWTSTSGEQARL